MLGEVEGSDKGKERQRKACLISARLHANLLCKLAVKSIPETGLRRRFPPLRRLSSGPASLSLQEDLYLRLGAAAAARLPSRRLPRPLAGVDST